MKKSFSKNQIRASIIRTGILTKKTLLRFFRNPKSLGFLVGIPVMYYIILGLIFGGSGTTGVSEYTIGWIDDDSSEANSYVFQLDTIKSTMEDLDNITIEEYDNKDDANEDALRDEIDAYIYFPEGYEASLEASNSSSTEEPLDYEIYFVQSVSPTTRSIIKNLVQGIINGVVNYDPNAIDVSYEEKSVKGQEVNQLTYSAPGYILYGPMTILSFALIILTGEKKDGIFRRLSSTEAKNHEIIFSNIIADILLVFMQILIGSLILFLFGWNPVIFSMFDAIVGFIITVFLFSFFILALAFVLAPVFKDPDSAGGGVWIILIPLMMFSGVFVPTEFFGEEINAIVSWLPTRHTVIIFQNLLLKGLPLSDPSTLMYMGFLTLWTIGTFILGVILFDKFKR